MEAEDDACWYGEDPFLPGPMIVVDFLGAMIAPAKVGGDPWDVGGAVSESAVSDFAGLVAGIVGLVFGGSDIIAELVGIVASATGKPDPMGTIEWDVGRGWEVTDDIPRTDNTFTPAWQFEPFEFEQGVSLRWRISLEDRDHSDPADPIGNFILTSEQFEQAAEESGDVWLKTNDSQVPLIKVNASFR